MHVVKISAEYYVTRQINKKTMNEMMTFFYILSQYKKKTIFEGSLLFTICAVS